MTRLNPRPDVGEASPAENRLRRWLVTLQAIANVGFPLYACIYTVHRAAMFGIASDWLGGLIYFLLVLVFLAFLQLICFSYQGDRSVRSQVIGLLAPIVYMGASTLVQGEGFGWFMFQQGALYTLAIMLAYGWIVFVRPVVSGSVWRWGRDFGFNLLASFAQLFFLGPGLYAGVLFSVILLRQQGTIGLQRWQDYLNLAFFLLTLVQLAHHEYRWMHRAAPEL